MKETKNRNGFRRAALPVFAMLIVAILSLTTVTYAWFTTGRDASVDSFDLNIAAGGGLEISIDGKNWSSTLSADDIKNYYAPEGPGKDENTYAFFGGKGLLSPVSTDGAYDASLAMNFYSGVIENGLPGAKLKSASKAAGGYLKFDIYFRNGEAENLNVTLTGTNVGEPKKGNEAIEDQQGHLAARMAFVVAGSRNSLAAGNDLTANTTAGTAVIYEPNATSHTESGINDYKAGTKAASLDGKIESYYALVGVYSEGESISRFEEKDGVLKSVTTKGEEETYFTLESQTVTKVTVYIWVEGQDVDCTNYISSNSFSVALKFVATTPKG